MRQRQFPYKASFAAAVIMCMLLVLVAGCTRKTQQKPIPQAQPIPQTQPISQTQRTAVNPVWPGEFEKHKAMWLMWPSEVYNQSNRPVIPVTINLVKALSRYIPVNMMASSNDEVTRIKKLFADNGFSGNNVRFYIVNHYSIWARDVGPLFVKKNNRLQVVDFGFNNYTRDGNALYVTTEAQVDRLSAGKVGVPVIWSSLITEGGGIESNGRGVLMTTESVTLVRNPGKTKKQIEAEFKRVLGVSKVVWLKKGLAEDDKITTGHINEIARFSDPHTILLARVLPQDRYASKYSQESYLRMEENYKILQKATDAEGKPFKIIRIPMPPTLYAEADRQGSNPPPCRSYLNYAVTNGAVMSQTYWKPGRSAALKATEDQVASILRKAFPGRAIVGIDAENVNQWGGGIHCITQHMPL